MTKTTIKIEPSRWVDESYLQTITGFTARKIKEMRNAIWIEGVHFKKFSPSGSQSGRSLIYNRIAIDQFFEGLAA